MTAQHYNGMFVHWLYLRNWRPASLCSGPSKSFASIPWSALAGRKPVEIVFRDERLPDGCYSDLVRPNAAQHRVPRVVVTTRTGDWDFYFEALGKGAFDVIRCPCYATDVEMTVIRAVREERGQAWSHDAAA